MKLLKKNLILKIRVATLFVFLCVLAGGFSYTWFSAAGAAVEVGLDSEPKIVKYSKFPHSKHRKKECSSCHKFPSSNWEQVREDPFPDITEYPKHTSCLSCHRRQFFGSARPAICTICHTNPSPRNSKRHPFPNPREVFDKSAKGKKAVTDFEISFPHETHVAMMSENRMPGMRDNNANALFIKSSFVRRASEDSCATCHQTYKPQGEEDDEYFTAPPEDLGDAFWLKKGTFKTVPTGHTTCFSCHSTDSGMLPEPKDCATCHKLKSKAGVVDFDRKTAAPMKISDKIMLTAWRKRDSSAKFQHEFLGHVDMECASCHNVDSMNTLDAATKKVNISSCAMCHVTETSDDGGILNYEVDARNADAAFQCVKCHLSYGKLAIPESHLKAITDQAGP